jgi:hypothetical protein
MKESRFVRAETVQSVSFSEDCTGEEPCVVFNERARDSLPSAVALRGRANVLSLYPGKKKLLLITNCCPTASAVPTPLRAPRYVNSLLDL